MKKDRKWKDKKKEKR